jgi:adenylate kinase family enzyme
MRRVCVLGPAGAGKTTVAWHIAGRTGLPVIHLDVIFWRAGWARAPADEARRALDDAIAGERWIVDGNFLDFERREERFDRADTVIFLDLPRRTYLRRVLWRRVRDRRRRRPDLPEGADESVDLGLLRWIWSYGRTDRPRVMALLAGLDPEVTVHHLRAPAEVSRYLASV